MDEIGEAELLSAGKSGVIADATMDGGKRPLRAGVLRRCCHELKEEIDPRGLRLNNAVVAGCLDLAGLTVPFPLRFEGCEFDSAPVVEGAEIFELSLTGCPRLPGLLGNGLRLRRDLDLSRSVMWAALSGWPLSRIVQRDAWQSARSSAGQHGEYRCCTRGLSP